MITGVLISEADIKKAVDDWLTFQDNLGLLLFFRLNAGDFIVTNPDGSHRRRIKGAKKGAADFEVLQPAFVRTSYKGVERGEPHPVCRVTFLEIKKRGSDQSSAQKMFETKVTRLHARYFVVRSVEEVEEILR